MNEPYLTLEHDGITLLTCIHPETGETVIEEFRPIKDYVGKYEVSNFGRVKSIKTVRGKGVIMKFAKCRGYYILALINFSGKKVTRTIHQLVAETFLNHDRCGYKLVINHKKRSKQRHEYRIYSKRLLQRNF